MSALTEHMVPEDPRVRPLPYSIDAVGGALAPAKRMEFFRELGQAEEDESRTAIFRKWWMEALFDSQPGRERRLANAEARRNLHPLPSLVEGDE